MNPVFFSDAHKSVMEFMQGKWTEVGCDVLIVRDLFGRHRVILQRSDNIDLRAVEEIRNGISNETIGKYGYPADESVLFSDELIGLDDLFAENNEATLEIDRSEDRRLLLCERQAEGRDWIQLRKPSSDHPPRLVFYGVKGGVGRSTALQLYAFHLASIGKHVVIFDLDLESPGVSSAFLSPEMLPDYGIIDWFVESAVGQGDELLNMIYVRSPMVPSSYSGEIYVVPCYGSRTDEYVSKLDRCYNDVFINDSVLTWSDRLLSLIERVEKSLSPDVVLLDSRAGIHDIAGALITRMDAFSLLFAVNTNQTWKAYDFLLKEMKRGKSEEYRRYRENLQVVGALVPEIEADKYRSQLRENSWSLFLDHVYDEEVGGSIGVELELFTFAKDEEDAPHSPIWIYWSNRLMYFEPTKNNYDDKLISDLMKDFTTKVDNLIGVTNELF
jgi:hypothetical protein